MQRTSSAFTCYANYHFTVNNEARIHKNYIFQKFNLTFLKISFFPKLQFFCIGHQSISYDMHNIIHLQIMPEIVSKNGILQKYIYMVQNF